MNKDILRHKPLCFVIMPFGIKPDGSGRDINFDQIYSTLIQPSIVLANMQPLRADEDAFTGIIHKAMYERLMLCDFAIADITTSNPNVFYELGIRHGVRPHSTLPVYAEGNQIPFDLSSVRTLPYQLDKAGKLTDCQNDIQKLSSVLKESVNPKEDSPLFQLVNNWPRPDIARLKTDNFRELVDYNADLKSSLRNARRSGSEAVDEIAGKLDIASTEPGVVIDIMLSYRATKNWQGMVNTIRDMAPYVSRSVMVQEQLAFALNRLGESAEAETVCLDILQTNGYSSETNGILGRIYKDRWRRHTEEGEELLARGLLQKAINAYLKGYNADIRDTYPGINALTLMEFAPEMREQQASLFGALEYALKLRLGSPSADYWDHATLFELQILKQDYTSANLTLINMASAIRESWEPETTLRNIKFIKEAFALNGTELSDLEDTITRLTKLI